MNEQELIQGLVGKNEEAFRWLVNSYRNKVFGTVLNIIQDVPEAEEATQDVFIQVFESAGSFKGESSLGTWIYRIAVRKALDKVRRRNTRQKLQQWLPWWMPDEKKSDADHSTFYHPGIALDQKEKAATLFKAINSLPEKQRVAFTLIKVQGMSYNDVSAILQQNVKAIESLITRARINLQKQLEHLHKPS